MGSEPRGGADQNESIRTLAHSWLGLTRRCRTRWTFGVLRRADLEPAAGPGKKERVTIELTYVAKAVA